MEKSGMKVTFLGTGTSQGVPVITCDCQVCKSNNIKDCRLRSSVLVEIDEKVFVIDSGPDFRQQMLRTNTKRLDGILFTHEHIDHMAGLDDIRAFNFAQKNPMDIYAEDRVHRAIKRIYNYVFTKEKYPGIPAMTLHLIENKEFKMSGVAVIPIRTLHLKLPVFGFRIGDFTYISDTNYISPEELEKIKGTKILVIGALRKEKHISHFNLEEALEMIDKTKPGKSYITHISHLMGLHQEVQKELPDNVFLAYDGLVLEV